jgi:hypothetical protein
MPLGVDKLAAFQPGKCFDGFANFLLGKAQFVEALEIELGLRASAKEMSETKSGIPGYGAGAIQNLSDAICWDVELAR